LYRPGKVQTTRTRVDDDMKVSEIIADPHSAELERIKSLEKSTKVRKARIKTQQAQQKLRAAQAPTKPL
jgi:hypothetical protein